MVAPYEADAQLAHLSRTGAVDAVITEDSDYLPYGCKKVKRIALILAGPRVCGHRHFSLDFLVDVRTIYPGCQQRCGCYAILSAAAIIVHPSRADCFLCVCSIRLKSRSCSRWITRATGKKYSYEIWRPTSRFRCVTGKTAW